MNHVGGVKVKYLFLMCAFFGNRNRYRIKKIIRKLSAYVYKFIF